MGSDTRVALGGVEVLVPGQFLDLAEVGAGAKEFGGEHVPERVRGHVLAGGHSGGIGVAAERCREDRDREPTTPTPTNSTGSGSRARKLHVVAEERLERRVNRDRPLPTPFRLPHPQQAPLDVDVAPVERKELATAQTRERKQSKQKPV